MKVLTVLMVLACTVASASNRDTIRISKDLYLIPLNQRVFIHVSTLQSQEFGVVPCNGIVYIDKNEALIFDTPADSIQSIQLIDWIRKEYPGIVFKGLVVNHFHNDCIAGLAVFHREGIRSYANSLTKKILKERGGRHLPQVTFKTKMILHAGDGSAINYYPGPAHTRDNIVSYLGNEKILFGGCPVKAIGAGKGNIADADLRRYSNTISNVVKKFPDAKVIVPGHGTHGTMELLDYTIKLFKE
jgi:metallo-beta-lactamase class B